MTLQELIYQIDGKLEHKFLPDNNSRVVLLDNLGGPAKVLRPVGPSNEWHREEVEAFASGKTPDEARINLVAILSGNVLKHDWPVMWTSTTVSLRIPETLTA